MKRPGFKNPSCIKPSAVTADDDDLDCCPEVVNEANKLELVNLKPIFDRVLLSSPNIEEDLINLRRRIDLATS